MSSCEKCWGDANHSVNPQLSVPEEYDRLIAERKDNPCTPEEQAGQGAKSCPRCHRMTLHRITNECTNKQCHV